MAAPRATALFQRTAGSLFSRKLKLAVFAALAAGAYLDGAAQRNSGEKTALGDLSPRTRPGQECGLWRVPRRSDLFKSGWAAS